MFHNDIHDGSNFRLGGTIPDLFQEFCLVLFSLSLDLTQQLSYPEPISSTTGMFGLRSINDTSEVLLDLIKLSMEFKFSIYYNF